MTLKRIGLFCFPILNTQLTPPAWHRDRDRLREDRDHSDEKITVTHHDGEVGWSPVRNHPVNVRGGQVSDREESQVLAALAVSEFSAALQ